MNTERLQSWGFLIGTPAFFLIAYILGGYPHLVDVPLCGVRMFLGIECPGCGMTHAMVALARGHLGLSISYHPLAVVIALWLVYRMGRAVVTVVRARPLHALVSDRTRMLLCETFVAALMVQWIVKLFLSRA
jgi:hypothetical protein